MDAYPHITAQHEILEHHVNFRFKPEPFRKVGIESMPKEEDYDLIKLRRVYHFNIDSSDHVILTISKPVLLLIDKGTNYTRYVNHENEIDCDNPKIVEKNTSDDSDRSQFRLGKYFYRCIDDEMTIEAILEQRINNCSDCDLRGPQTKTPDCISICEEPDQIDTIFDGTNLLENRVVMEKINSVYENLLPDKCELSKDICDKYNAESDPLESDQIKKHHQNKCYLAVRDYIIGEPQHEQCENQEVIKSMSSEHHKCYETNLEPVLDRTLCIGDKSFAEKSLEVLTSQTLEIQENQSSSSRENSKQTQQIESNTGKRIKKRFKTVKNQWKRSNRNLPSNIGKLKRANSIKIRETTQTNEKPCDIQVALLDVEKDCLNKTRDDGNINMVKYQTDARDCKMVCDELFVNQAFKPKIRLIADGPNAKTKLEAVPLKQDLNTAIVFGHSRREANETVLSKFQKNVDIMDKCPKNHESTFRSNLENNNFLETFNGQNIDRNKDEGGIKRDKRQESLISCDDFVKRADITNVSNYEVCKEDKNQIYIGKSLEKTKMVVDLTNFPKCETIEENLEKATSHNIQPKLNVENKHERIKNIIYEKQSQNECLIMINMKNQNVQHETFLGNCNNVPTIINYSLETIPLVDYSSKNLVDRETTVATTQGHTDLANSEIDSRKEDPEDKLYDYQKFLEKTNNVDHSIQMEINSKMKYIHKEKLEPKIIQANKFIEIQKLADQDEIIQEKLVEDDRQEKQQNTQTEASDMGKLNERQPEENTMYMQQQEDVKDLIGYESNNNMKETCEKTKIEENYKEKNEKQLEKATEVAIVAPQGEEVKIVFTEPSEALQQNKEIKGVWYSGIKTQEGTNESIKELAAKKSSHQELKEAIRVIKKIQQTYEVENISEENKGQQCNKEIRTDTVQTGHLKILEERSDMSNFQDVFLRVEHKEHETNAVYNNDIKIYEEKNTTDASIPLKSQDPETPESSSSGSNVVFEVKQNNAQENLKLNANPENRDKTNEENISTKTKHMSTATSEGLSKSNEISYCNGEILNILIDVPVNNNVEKTKKVVLKPKQELNKEWIKEMEIGNQIPIVAEEAILINKDVENSTNNPMQHEETNSETQIGENFIAKAVIEKTNNLITKRKATSIHDEIKQKKRKIQRKIKDGNLIQSIKESTKHTNQCEGLKTFAVRNDNFNSRENRRNGSRTEILQEKKAEIVNKIETTNKLLTTPRKLYHTSENLDNINKKVERMQEKDIIKLKDCKCVQSANHCMDNSKKSHMEFKELLKEMSALVKNLKHLKINTSDQRQRKLIKLSEYDIEENLVSKNKDVLQNNQTETNVTLVNTYNVKVACLQDDVKENLILMKPNADDRKLVPKINQLIKKKRNWDLHDAKINQPIYFVDNLRNAPSIDLEIFEAVFQHLQVSEVKDMAIHEPTIENRSKNELYKIDEDRFIEKKPRLSDNTDFFGFTKEEQMTTFDAVKYFKQAYSNIDVTSNKLSNINNDNSISCPRRKAQDKTHSKVHLCSHVQPFWCNLCLEAFARIGHLKRHTDNSHFMASGIKPVSENNQLFKCGFCNFSSSYIVSLKHHMRTHDIKKVYLCNVCNYSTVDHLKFERHNKLHDSEQYECEECGYMSLYRHDWELHMQLHSRKDIFKCEKCDFSTAHLGYHQAHLSIHRLKQECSLDKEVVESRKLFYTCTVCNHSDKNQLLLFRHGLKKHSDLDIFDIIASDTDTTMTMCNKCGFCVKEFSKIEKHLIIHTSLS